MLTKLHHDHVTTGTAHAAATHVHSVMSMEPGMSAPGSSYCLSRCQGYAGPDISSQTARTSHSRPWALVCFVPESLPMLGKVYAIVDLDCLLKTTCGFAFANRTAFLFTWSCFDSLVRARGRQQIQRSYSFVQLLQRQHSTAKHLSIFAFCREHAPDPPLRKLQNGMIDTCMT